MARVNLLDILYSKNRSAAEFNFDMLVANPISMYLSPYDIMALYEIASSTKLAAKIDLKYKEIDRIMKARGFKKFAAGTNRVVYSFLEDQSFVMKIAVDKVGLGDNPAEFRNQNLLKPFVTKVFEVTPCGTVGMFERVLPITNIQEFISIWEDVFEMITSKVIGKYVVDDIGSKYFMNWGTRVSFGPCLLDFPYVFELDGNKLFCNKRDMITGLVCGGVIDYDEGFNNLVCTKCGKKFIAKELEVNKQEKLIILEGDNIMKVKLVLADGTVLNPASSSDFIQKPVRKHVEKKSTGFKVHLEFPDQEEVVEQPEYKVSGSVEKPKCDFNITSKFIPTPDQGPSSGAPVEEEPQVETTKEEVVEQEPVVEEPKQVREDYEDPYEYKEPRQSFKAPDSYDDEDNKEYLRRQRERSKTKKLQQRRNSSIDKF